MEIRLSEGGGAEKFLNFRYDHIDGNCIFAAHRDDNVSPAFTRLDKFEMHRFDRRNVLLHDRFDGTVAFEQITLQPAQEPFVGIGIDEQFDVHQFA